MTRHGSGETGFFLKNPVSFPRNGGIRRMSPFRWRVIRVIRGRQHAGF